MRLPFYWTYSLGYGSLPSNGTPILWRRHLSLFPGPWLRGDFRLWAGSLECFRWEFTRDLGDCIFVRVLIRRFYEILSVHILDSISTVIGFQDST